MFSKLRFGLAGLVLVATSLACYPSGARAMPPRVVVVTQVVTRLVPWTTVVGLTLTPTPPATGPEATPTPTPTPAYSVPPASATPTPSETPTVMPPTPSTPMRVVWLDDCDPRQSVNFCHMSSSLDVFKPFYGVLESLNASITYTLTTQFIGYDVVIADFCGPIGLPRYYDALSAYVSAGGSVVVMGDNFCQGVAKADSTWLASADAANLVTKERGITITADDDMSQQQADPPTLARLGLGVNRLVSIRHAFLKVHTPAAVGATLAGRPFVGLYDHIGTMAVIPDTLFHITGRGGNTGASNDNFVFWRNLLAWLADKAHAKRH